MDELPRVRLSGALEGDYVVLRRDAGGVLRTAPEQPEGRPKVATLIYARYRHGALSVGIGDDIDEAVRNGRTDEALYADYVGDGFDGFMDFEELRAHLHGLLEFPADLDVENERPLNPDPEAPARLLAPPEED